MMLLWVVLAVLPALVTPASIFGGGASVLRPVIIVPGKGGNQIEGYIDNSFRFGQDMTGYNCPARKHWFRLWLDLWKLLPSNQLCFSEVMELTYDEERRASRNKPGVYTRIPGFGETWSIEYLDPSWAAWLLGNSGEYLASFVKELVNIGYTRGKNLLAAPYDFRLLPHSQDEYFDDLKWLIEKTYIKNNGEKVVLVAHSMGGLFTTYFLQSMKQEWKDKYVNTFLSVNTPWSGATKILGLFISGYDYEDMTDTINAVLMRRHQRTYETMFFLLPKATTWAPDEPLVTTPEVNYTVSNLMDLFERLNHTEAYPIMEDIKDFEYSLTFPGVNTMCWYSTTETKQTPEIAVYHEDQFPDGAPEYVMGDGDGTVNLRSLRHCQDMWDKPISTQGFAIQEFRGPSHINVFESDEFVKEIKKILVI